MKLPPCSGDMMERKYAKFFLSLVKELIPKDVDKERLFDCLRTYQSSHDLYQLLSDLRLLLNEPNKLELYEFVRPLILLQHQIEYCKRTPAAPGVKLRTVRLYHHHGESLGFAVRGGFEHSVGIFVTEVAAGSQAERQGLKVGDEVVRVNGFTIAEAIHIDVLNLIKSKEDIVLKVTYIGMLPVKDDPSGPVTWQYVDSLDDGSDQEEHQRKRHSPDIKIFIDSTGHASLGCSILSESGPAAVHPGIFVEKVRPGSIADQVGLEPGDQIMEVNETSFRKINWQQAVLALKSSRQLTIVIRQNTGSSLIKRWTSTQSAPVNGSHNTTVNTALPASPLGLSNIEPIYSTINKTREALTSEAPERRISASTAPDQLNELDLIEQQLNRNAITQHSPSLPEPWKPLSPSPTELPSSLTYSNRLSVINTAADVHTTPFVSSQDDASQRGQDEFSPYSRDESSPYSRDESSLYSRDKSSPSSIDEQPYYPQKPAIGGAAAFMAQRRLQNNSKNTPGLLGPPDEYEWSENVRAQDYDLFSTSMLDGRRLLTLTYNKNADLGIAIEGGLGSPLGGKILVAILFDGGIAMKSGKIHVGDQLMMINGQMMLGVTAAEAERIIQNAANTAKNKVELMYCESSLVNDESSSTYF